MSHRSLCVLLLIGGALAQLSCSALGQQPAPDTGAAPAGSAPAAGTTLLGGIGPGHQPAASGPSASATSKSAAAQTQTQTQTQAAQTQAAQALAAQCSDLRAQIRGEQAIERAAPSTSISEEIVNASIAKADKRIDELEQQYDMLGCPDSQLPATHQRVPLLPPAPGALPPG
ncbi:MAG TPA: hypothetical protein VMD56_13840 [Steroidobacteraceae bacterium]|nr:hypothetical protein [Steroidobacteraceae bacterium]